MPDANGYLAPAYLKLLPPGNPPTTDLYELLAQICRRMGMVKRRAEPDLFRAAHYLVKWWREEGGLIAASTALQINPADPVPLPNNTAAITQGWGFDFQWELRPDEIKTGVDMQHLIQERMERCIDDYLIRAKREETEVSATQKKKKMLAEDKTRRATRYSQRERNK